MVKGVSRRVVVVDSPDERLFEQAIFIVRNNAAGEGVTSRALVEEARRLAKMYAGGRPGRWKRLWQRFGVWLGAALGAGAIGLLWLAASMSAA